MIEEIGEQALRVFNGADGVKGVIKLEEAGSRDNAKDICVRISFTRRGVFGEAINRNYTFGQFHEFGVKQAGERVHIKVGHDILIKE